MKSLIICFLASLLVIISTHLAKSQNDHLKKVYKENVIRPHAGYYMRNDESLSEKQLLPLLLSFEESANELKDYKKYITTGTILGAAGIASCIAMFSVGRESNKTKAYLFGGVSLAFSVSSYIFRTKATRRFQNSLWLYNRDVLIQKY